MLSVSINVSIGARRFFAPSDKEASAAFGMVFKKRGYIVICTRPGPQYAIGQTITNIWGYETRRKFVVAAFTTQQDCEWQLNFIAKSMKAWTRTPLKYSP